ncbi:hypothetical protein HMPREF1451_00253 [Helicobacter pylori HP260BFii]|nr:hypothetical protein HMPREF1451_00253 [Helicobacter pylori HP260BFii]
MFGVCKSRGFLKIGGVFKAKTEQGYSKQCFWLKFLVGSYSAMKNAIFFNLLLQINYSKTQAT